MTLYRAALTVFGLDALAPTAPRVTTYMPCRHVAWPTRESVYPIVVILCNGIHDAYNEIVFILAWQCVLDTTTLDASRTSV